MSQDSTDPPQSQGNPGDLSTAGASGVSSLEKDFCLKPISPTRMRGGICNPVVNTRVNIVNLSKVKFAVDDFFKIMINGFRELSLDVAHCRIIPARL